MHALKSTNKINQASSPPTIVDQLRSEIALAEKQGIRVRMDPLQSDAESGWFQMGDDTWLILDLAQQAGEQLQIVREAIRAHQNQTR